MICDLRLRISLSNSAARSKKARSPDGDAVVARPLIVMPRLFESSVSHSSQFCHKSRAVIATIPVIRVAPDFKHFSLETHSIPAVAIDCEYEWDPDCAPYL